MRTEESWPPRRPAPSPTSSRGYRGSRSRGTPAGSPRPRTSAASPTSRWWFARTGDGRTSTPPTAAGSSPTRPPPAGRGAARANSAVFGSGALGGVVSLTTRGARDLLDGRRGVRRPLPGRLPVERRGPHPVLLGVCGERHARRAGQRRSRRHPRADPRREWGRHPEHRGRTPERAGEAWGWNPSLATPLGGLLAGVRQPGSGTHERERSDGNAGGSGYPLRGAAGALHRPLAGIRVARPLDPRLPQRGRGRRGHADPAAPGRHGVRNAGDGGAQQLPLPLGERRPVHPQPGRRGLSRYAVGNPGRGAAGSSSRTRRPRTSAPSCTARPRSAAGCSSRAGLRRDQWRIRADRFAGRDEGDFSPRASAGYRLGEAAFVWVGASRGFRVPSLTELYADGLHFQFPVGPGIDVLNWFRSDPTLAAERGTSWEAGLRGGRGPLSFETTCFDQTVADYVDQVVVVSDPSLDLEVDPVTGRTIIRGITYNASLDARLRGCEAAGLFERPRFRMRASGSVLDTENLDTGEALGRAPANALHLMASTRLPSLDLEVGGRATLAGSRTRGLAASRLGRSGWGVTRLPGPGPLPPLHPGQRPARRRGLDPGRQQPDGRVLRGLPGGGPAAGAESPGLRGVPVRILALGTGLLPPGGRRHPRRPCPGR